MSVKKCTATKAKNNNNTLFMQRNRGINIKAELTVYRFFAMFSLSFRLQMNLRSLLTLIICYRLDYYILNDKTLL